MPRLRRSVRCHARFEIPRPQPPYAGTTWITHPHPDHTGGAKSLFHGFLESPIYGESDIDVATHTVTAGTQFPFGEGLVTVWATPGHTDRHISYLLENSDGLHVFCGDTLFSAGCGRVFTGTIEQLYDSFHRFQPTARRNAVLPGARIYRLQSALCPAYRAGQCRHSDGLGRSRPHADTACQPGARTQSQSIFPRTPAPSSGTRRRIERTKVKQRTRSLRCLA